MVDEAIKRKIAIFQEYLEKVSPYAMLSTKELLNDEEKRAAMERWFQLMVDEAIDINAALAYQLGGKIPESYKSTFYELVPIKVIEQDFVDKIAESVKIRNQMTHDYDKLPHDVLIEQMKKYVDIYKEYARMLVGKFIKPSQ